eukprot:g18147.t1
MTTLKKLSLSLRKDLSGSLSHCNPLVISSALKLLDHILKQTRYYSHIAFRSTCLRSRNIPNRLQSTFRPSQFGPVHDKLYINNIQILQKRFSLRLLKHTLSAMCRHLLALQSALPQLRASLSQICKGPLLFFILRRIHNLNLRFYSTLPDIKNHKDTKLTGACHQTQVFSTQQVLYPTQDLPHNVPAAIDHVVTISSPADANDLVTSAKASHVTSDPANHGCAAATVAATDTAAEAAPAAHFKDDITSATDAPSTDNITNSAPAASSNPATSSTPNP